MNNRHEIIEIILEHLNERIFNMSETQREHLYGFIDGELDFIIEEINMDNGVEVCDEEI